MKKAGVLFILVLLSFSLFSFVSAQDPGDMPDAGIGGEDVEKIQKTIEGAQNITGLKSKAEMRIEAINKYVGPITKVLFGVELSLSWIFVFSLLMWLLLIVFIVGPLKDIFGVNSLLALGISAIISSLAMYGFGDKFVIWMDSLAQTWYASLMAIVGAIIVAVIYSIFMRAFGKKIEEAKEKAAKEETKKHRKVIKTAAEVAKEELESRK